MHRAVSIGAAADALQPFFFFAVMLAPPNILENWEFQRSLVSVTSFVHNNAITNDTINRDTAVADTLFIK